MSNSIHPKAKIYNGCNCENSILNAYSRLKTNVEFRDSILGDYSYVSSNSIVNMTEIGKFTSIGPGCYIGLWEHDTDVSTHSFYLYESSGEFVKGYSNYKKDKIKTFLGNDVWVGANVSIKKGVKIGNGAIIGSSAVITKDVEPFSIVVGNPAKLLKYRYSKEDIELMQKAAWWDLPREKLQQLIDDNLFHDFDVFKSKYLKTFSAKRNK